MLEDLQREKMTPPEGMDIPSDPKGQPDQDAGEEEKKDLSEKTTSSKSFRAGDVDENTAAARRNRETAKNIKMIMKVLEGSFQRSMATKVSHPGGLPRKWKRMRTLEIEDSDPMEFFLWSDNTSPLLPRIQLREKESTGGEIAVLRDVSTSMMGEYSDWASSVVRGVIELARTKNMRVGYLEFNHKADPHARCGGGRGFFTREYPRLLDLASQTECSGNTNYEEALKGTVAEFRGRGRRNKHVLFITDGIPTSGDISMDDDDETSGLRSRPQSSEKQLPEYLNAGRLAGQAQGRVRPLRGMVKRMRRQGIRIHSIFIGSKTYPSILRKISEETGGSQFVAYRNSEKIMQVERRDKFMARTENSTDSFDPIKAAFEGRIHTVTGKL